MKEERDLGPIYGSIWNNFNGVNQLQNVIDTLKTNPDDRRMIVSAWSPSQLKSQALPPCHYAWQVTVINGKLNLLWLQRSVDVALGLPYNIASYGLLLLLLAREAKLTPGMLIGFLGDVHIYENHMENIIEQTKREPYQLPNLTLLLDDDATIFDWTADDIQLTGYKCHEKINYEIAV